MGILEQVEDFVKQYFEDHDGSKLFYHDLSHTQRIVKSCKKIAEKADIGDFELENVLIAAWFHDIGYFKSRENHEEESIKIATNFLEKLNYPEDGIDRVKSCILATKMEHKPQSLPESIIKDADMSSLGKKSFKKRAKELRKELEETKGENYTDEQWNEKNIDFLVKHHYYTKYGRKKYAKRKKKNIKKMLAKKIKAKKKLGRGVETMFRISIPNHIELSAIADNKANIMLSINTIVISIVLSALMPKFDKNPHLIVPVLILLAVCVSTIVLATISTIPKITKGEFTVDEIKNKTANLLFFGNFHKMAKKDFEYGVHEMIKDPDFLYGSLAKDLYSLGRVLHNKYRFLNLCYKVFMFGVIIAVCAFIVAMVTAPEPVNF